MSAKLRLRAHDKDRVVSDGHQTVHDEDQTFIMPFVILTFLTLPNLAVPALSKQTVGYDALLEQSYYKFVQIGFWIAVPLALLFGTIFLLRSKSMGGRIAVACLMAVLAIGLAYVMWPK